MNQNIFDIFHGGVLSKKKYESYGTYVNNDEYVDNHDYDDDTDDDNDHKKDSYTAAGAAPTQTVSSAATTATTGLPRK